MSDTPFSSLVRKSVTERSLLSGTNALELLGTKEGQELHKAARGTWDPNEHPRGRNGRFIELGGIVDLPDGGEGRVVGISGSKVTIEDSNGKKSKHDAGDLSQVADANEGENRQLKPPSSDRMKEIDDRLKELDAEDKKDKLPPRKDGIQPYLEHIDRVNARYDERKKLAQEYEQLDQGSAQVSDPNASADGGDNGVVGQTPDGHPVSVSEDPENPGTWWVDTAEGGVQENFPNEEQAKKFANSLVDGHQSAAGAADGGVGGGASNDGAPDPKDPASYKPGDTVKYTDDHGYAVTSTVADAGPDYIDTEDGDSIGPDDIIGGEPSGGGGNASSGDVSNADLQAAHQQDGGDSSAGGSAETDVKRFIDYAQSYGEQRQDDLAVELEDNLDDPDSLSGYVDEVRGTFGDEEAEALQRYVDELKRKKGQA